MYEVRIDADPDEFLDWGEPLSEQSELVRSAYAALRESSLPAGAEGLDGANSALAEALRGAGIKGLRYLDQGSRASGEGSHNYVVFDDSLAPSRGSTPRAAGSTTARRRRARKGSGTPGKSPRQPSSPPAEIWLRDMVSMSSRQKCLRVISSSIWICRARHT